MYEDDPPAVACPKCKVPVGEHCRTAGTGVLLPPHGERLEAIIVLLQSQRDNLQEANTQEVLRRRELERAATYVLSNVPGHSGTLDHLRHALVYKP